MLVGHSPILLRIVTNTTPSQKLRAYGCKSLRKVEPTGIPPRGLRRCVILSCQISTHMPERKRQLNIAMVGSGFIARAHSNAFHQVGHFFEVPFSLCTKVVCARDRQKLEAFAQQWDWQETALEWQSVVTRKDITV